MITATKHMVRKVFRAAGFELLHRTPDPVLHMLRAAHERLRFIPSREPSWDHTLGEIHFSAHLRRLLVRHEIDLVIDIGANTGQYGRLLRELGYRGEICSFEPEPNNFSQLQQAAVTDRAWRVYPVALGNAAAEVDLYVATNGVFNSLHPSSPYGRAAFPSDLSLRKTVRVPIRRLDQLWKELTRSDCRRVLLKSDTQGHDLAVLQGGARSLQKCSVVQVEAAFCSIYDGIPGYRSSFDLLEASGFQIGGIFPLSTEDHSLALIEADVLFVRASSAQPGA